MHPITLRVLYSQSVNDAKHKNMQHAHRILKSCWENRFWSLKIKTARCLSQTNERCHSLVNMLKWRCTCKKSRCFMIELVWGEKCESQVFCNRKIWTHALQTFQLRSLGSLCFQYFERMIFWSFIKDLWFQIFDFYPLSGAMSCPIWGRFLLCSYWACASFAHFWWKVK